MAQKGVRISVITPVLNRRDMIPMALTDVQAQAIDACEHLVVDGGSQDGTQDVVVSTLGARLIDAPGSSIYEAINIGIGEAHGDIIGLLNSDDRLPKGTLQSVLSAFEAYPDSDIVHGHAKVVPLKDGPHSDKGEGTLSLSKSFGLESILFGKTHMNTCYLARPVFERVGLFDTGLRISADREWMARATLAGVSVRSVDRVLYIYMSHNESLTIGRDKTAELEWVGEHLEFARRYLTDQALDAQSRKAFLHFHGKEVAHEAYLHLRKGELNAFFTCLGAGFHARKGWPLDACVPLMRILWNRLRQSQKPM